MKLKRRIFLTISLILLLTIFISSFLYLSFFYYFFENLFTEKVLNSSKNISQNIVQIYLKYYNEGFSAFIKNIFEVYENEKDLIDFFVVDMNGKVCFSLDEVNQRTKYVGTDRYIDIQLLDKVHQINTYHRKIFQEKSSKLQIIQPVFDFYQRHLYSVVFYYSYNTLVKNSLYFLLISFILFFILIIINYFFSNYFSSYLINPIDSLLGAVKKSHKEKYQTSIDIKSDHEFNLLINEFNKMMKIIRNERSLIINIIYSLKTGILAIDKNNNIILCNQAFSNLLKIDKLPDENQNCFNFFPCLKRLENIITETLKRGKSVSLQGEIFNELISTYFNIEIKPLIFDNFNAGVVIIIDDITEEIQIQKRLVQLQKGELINSLANGLAHDFNNLIGSIKSTATLANIEIRDNKLEKIAEIGEYLDIIYDIAKNAEKIVKHLLSLSKHREFKKDKINLIEVLDKVIRISKLSIDKSVYIEIKNFIVSPPDILGDEILLEELFFNLIVNASHSMTVMRKENEKWGGNINIEICEIESFSINVVSQNCYAINSNENINNLIGKRVFKISVADEGIGIEKDNFTKIFLPFFSTKSENIGTGLGLSMVLTLVELHKGIIDLTSEPGIGSTFSVFLPSSIE